MSLTRPRPSSLALAGLSLVCVGLVDAPARACGPNLAPIMVASSQRELCEAPRLVFAASVGAALGEDESARTIRGNSLDTEEAGVLDLSDALLEAGADGGEIEAAIDAYVSYREQLEADEAPPLPAIPAEFRLYLEGARAWRREDSGGARRAWRRVLALPEDQRRYRSVWAAYMLAQIGPGEPQSCADDERDWARVRALAEDGYADTLGLAAASYGEQARCWLSFEGDPVRAIELYAEQLASDGPSAEASLRMVIRDFFGELEPATAAESLRPLARSPLARAAVNAWLADYGDTARERGWTTIWLELLEAERFDVVADAGTLAWISYQGGDMDGAERWAKLADGDLLARWVLAKLELRRGELEPARRTLAMIEAELGGSPDARLVRDWRFRSAGAFNQGLAHSAAAERGMLELRAGHFEAALAAFLRAGSLLDAAYVAESLLSVEELETFIAAELPQIDGPADAQLREFLSWLLARRLARADQWARALPHYPARYRGLAQAQLDDIERLGDPLLDRLDRARVIWSLAKRTRESGMELQGTELGPDWTYYDGGLSREDVWASRERLEAHDRAAPSPAERRRVENRSDRGLPRFHYRWEAADLAWEAAALLPDNHPATARVLCLGGSWIEGQDPAGAERFYKAMVERNGAVEIARQADALRWFPEPEACSLAQVDFGAPALAPPPPAKPRPELAPDRAHATIASLGRRGLPLAALAGLAALLAFALLGGEARRTNGTR